MTGATGSVRESRIPACRRFGFTGFRLCPVPPSGMRADDGFDVRRCPEAFIRTQGAGGRPRGGNLLHCGDRPEACFTRTKTSEGPGRPETCRLTQLEDARLRSRPRSSSNPVGSHRRSPDHSGRRKSTEGSNPLVLGRSRRGKWCAEGHQRSQTIPYI